MKECRIEEYLCRFIGIRETCQRFLDLTALTKGNEEMKECDK
jgi:hypothetical protein